MDADVVFASLCALCILPVADETFGPLEIDVLDCLTKFLAHDVRERWSRGCDVGDGEVIL